MSQQWRNESTLTSPNERVTCLQGTCGRLRTRPALPLPWAQTVSAVSACQQARVVPYRSPSVGQNTRPQRSLSAIHHLLSHPLNISHVPGSPQRFLLLFQLSIGLNAALDAYEKKTKSKLLTHPLATQLQSCDSPTAILSVLQDLIQQFDRRRRSDERLTNWLNPTVNVLYAFSSTIGQGVGLVSL